MVSVIQNLNQDAINLITQRVKLLFPHEDIQEVLVSMDNDQVNKVCSKVAPCLLKLISELSD